jgi:hypothetical protein
MQKYTIKKGQQNFKPLESIWPTKAKGFKVTAKLTDNCYYSLEDWEGDATDSSFGMIG